MFNIFKNAISNLSSFSLIEQKYLLVSGIYAVLTGGTPVSFREMLKNPIIEGLEIDFKSSLDASPKDFLDSLADLKSKELVGDIGQIIHNAVYSNDNESLGQVFTPNELGLFISNLFGVDENTIVYDGACGSGSLFMSSLINKPYKLVGREYDKSTLILTKLNAFINKDFEFDLEQGNSTKPYKINFDKSVVGIMNPPYELKFGCMEIMESSLDTLPLGSLCAFIIPITKFSPNDAKVASILSKHTFLGCVKLSRDIFRMDMTSPIGVFIFNAGVPHDNKDYFLYDLGDLNIKYVKGEFKVCEFWDALTTKAIESVHNYFKNGSKDDTRLSVLEFVPYLQNIRYASGGDILKAPKKESIKDVQNALRDGYKALGLSYTNTDINWSPIYSKFKFSTIFKKIVSNYGLDIKKTDGMNPYISSHQTLNGYEGKTDVAFNIPKSSITMTRTDQQMVKFWDIPIVTNQMCTSYVLRDYVVKHSEFENKLLMYITAQLREYLCSNGVSGFYMIPYSVIEDVIIEVPTEWVN